jgi:hypothetical protein
LIKNIKIIVKDRKTKKEFTQDINTFYSSVKEPPLANEKLIYNEGIKSIFQRKCRKQAVENSVMMLLILLINNLKDYLKDNSWDY